MRTLERLASRKWLNYSIPFLVTPLKKRNYEQKNNGHFAMLEKEAGYYCNVLVMGGKSQY